MSSLLLKSTYIFFHEGQPYADKPYDAVHKNDSLIEEEQPYLQYNDQPYAEEYLDDPFAHKGQP